MGVGAAGTVLVAVLVALTLLPALLGFAGARLAPKPGSRAARREQADAAGRRAPAARWAPAGPGWSPGGRCSPCSSSWPACSSSPLPAPQLQLALPDNSTAAPDTPQRQAYDLISRALRPRPQRSARRPRRRASTRRRPSSPPARSPSPSAARRPARPASSPAVWTTSPTPPRRCCPTGRPASSPSSRRAARRTRRPADSSADLRDAVPGLEQQTGADLAVTGQTAVAIDVSDRLGRGAAAVRARRRRAGADPAAARLPLDPRADQGRGRLPAVGRRLVRRGRRRLPVGLARRPARRAGHRPGDQLPAGDPHGGAVRPGHGLRGLPRLPHARGVRRTAPSRARPSSPAPGTRPGSWSPPR